MADRIINLHNKAGSFPQIKKINTDQLSEYIGEYPKFEDEWNSANYKFVFLSLITTISGLEKNRKGRLTAPTPDEI